MNILMLASENASLPNAKVGGIGDVLRDMPTALASLGHRVDVVLPAYHHLATIPGMQSEEKFKVLFADGEREIELLRLDPRLCPHEKVGLWVLSSPHFAVGERGSIYHHDPDDAPFATDASLFALFCRAAVEAIKAKLFGNPKALHLHDWHTSLAALLIHSDPAYKPLRSIRLVYTIHNLALQGVRPFRNNPSSLENWFPGLKHPGSSISDPRAPDCVNLMRTGIVLADRVHVVSDTYAQEICRPSDHARGFFGGEGLEKDLQAARSSKRLFGIINGCDYTKASANEPRKLPALYKECHKLLLKWAASEEYLSSAHYIAERRLRNLIKMPRDIFLMTSVGRVTVQKLALLRYPQGKLVALDTLLDELGDHGALIMVGSGDRKLERFLVEVAARHPNFLYLRGYAEQASSMLYEMGDLFLMPSSFEPCGISQMLSMRAGQPCLVHGVGGLRDTVRNGIDGFVFEGSDAGAQAQAMIAAFRSALKRYREQPQVWQRIRAQAGSARFLWQDSARQYEKFLYDIRA